jgi:hypothetical protein
MLPTSNCRVHHCIKTIRYSTELAEALRHSSRPCLSLSLPRRRENHDLLRSCAGPRDATFQETMPTKTTTCPHCGLSLTATKSKTDTQLKRLRKYPHFGSPAICLGKGDNNSSSKRPRRRAEWDPSRGGERLGELADQRAGALDLPYGLRA